MSQINDKVLYFHINPLKNEVFYVGIGTKKRAFSKNGRSRFWEAVVAKYGFIVNIVAENLTVEEAKSLEIEYIKRIGRRDLGLGPLTNLADGGEGKFGAKESKEACELKSRLKKEFYSIPENRAKLCGKVYSKEVNLKKGKPGGQNIKARKITYNGVEYSCVKELYNKKLKGKISYGKLVRITRNNNILNLK